MQEDRKRILEMLEDGKVTADEAMMLLEQIGENKWKDSDVSPGEASRAATSHGEKMLRVRILVTEKGNAMPTNISVNLPLKLARVAGRLVAAMPQSAQEAMHAHDVDLYGIDWQEAIDALAETGGDIVNITHEGDDEQVTVRVYVE